MLIEQLRKCYLRLADKRIVEIECHIAELEMLTMELMLRRRSTAVVERAIVSSRRQLQKRITIAKWFSRGCN